MRVPFEWLKTYVAVRLSPKTLAERLTMAGLEVVAIHEANGEPVLDVEVTPNRADCLSIIGIAREVAAITGQRLKLPQGEGSRVKGRRSPHPSAPTLHPVKISIEDRQGCRRYIGRLIEGVTIAPSPAWMQARLLACGARPINNLVDITNYVLLEYGQPLHAFDHDRLAKGEIIVRRARANEPITTLDGMRRTLPPDTLVIADGERPVAVAGIMGGTGSEVTQGTRRVLLESAWFDPPTVRRTARALGLVSESSYRFERGVDPVGVETASVRAAALICELAGGREVSVVDVGAKPSARKAITLEPKRLSQWLGMLVSPPAIRTGLARLSCRVVSSDASSTFRVIPPSFRQDLAQEVDLYEEVARVTGYDRLPTRLPMSRASGAPSEASAAYWRLQSLRCLCASLGLAEAVTWSLVSEAELSRCGFSTALTVRLANPLSQDHAYLRPSLLIGLLQAVRRNLTQGVDGVRLFEVGSVVRPGDRVESVQLGVALSGVWLQDWRAKQACDFFRLKGLLEALASRLCDGNLTVVAASVPWAAPSQGTTVQLNGRAIGAAGQILRAITEALDIEEGVWYAELSVQGLVDARRSTRMVTAPAQFPPVKRDLSILISNETPFAEVARVIHEDGGALATRVELIDRYTGPQIPAGKCSLTFSIEYRDASRTLTAAEADALHQRIGQTLTRTFNAHLR